MIAPSHDIVAGQLLIASWFIVFALSMLDWTRRVPRYPGRATKYGSIGSLVVGLALACFLPSSGYILKITVMLALSIGLIALGRKYGLGGSLWRGLALSILGYAAVASQYVLMEMAR